jgi:L-alanine-DL-glutamate epimerase-like enolase superfamily enzyme
MTAAETRRAGTYGRLADLAVHVEGYQLTGLELAVSDQFTRLTTVVSLHGAGHLGIGEDTTYAPPDQLAFRAAGPLLPLAGHWTLDTFSAALERMNLFPVGPSVPDFLSFRRWAFESAALDLALRQANCSVADALGRTPRPVSFVVSPGPENSAGPTLARLALYPQLRLKLMVTPEWDDDLVNTLAATNAVDVVDLKGQYDQSVPVAVAPDAALYRRVLRAFPETWIEDPGITSETTPLLRAHREHLTWDAPIRAAADITALRWRPRCINIKPSRFGSARALLEAYDYCAHAGIRTYGGGQFELGPGRAQIQLLAALFHPDAPNDVAPTAFNEPMLTPGLPASPLSVGVAGPGFA